MMRALLLVLMQRRDASRPPLPAGLNQAQRVAGSNRGDLNPS